MTTVTGDPRIALLAGPLLAQFNAAGVLAAPDVQVARRLGRIAREEDERVLLAVALAVRALRGGSVCVSLDDLAALSRPEGEDAVPVEGLPWPDETAWRAAVEASPLVAVGVDGPADRPVRWVQGRLYLDRYWRDEQVVRSEVDARLAAPLPLPPGVTPDRLDDELGRLWPEPEDDRQRLATRTAALSRFTVITGGPGTGKTTTVARLLAVLQAVSGRPGGGGLRVALAAPTGKAAARLLEAVAEQVATLAPEDRRRVGPLQAGTVHRLLGWKPGSSTRFAHDRDHRLPHDVVVVDETSMVSLSLMARLLEALRPQARLVLVGDPDQLASVEAGAVLGDLVARPAAVVGGGTPAGSSAGVPAPPHGVVRLAVVHRFSQGIGTLAEAIRTGDADGALAALTAGDAGVEFVDTGDGPVEPAHVAGLRHDAADAGVALVTAARAGDAAAALAALESHRLLLAHRRGPSGVRWWAGTVESWVDEALGEEPRRRDGWYAGQPLLVTANDRNTGLYNGDTGVVVASGSVVDGSGDGSGDAPGRLVAVFGSPQRPLTVRPHRLPAVETVHAMTVHRAQGSQFAAVTVLLPPPTSALLTRELLYTAVTRARRRVRVVGSAAAVRAAVERPVRRASGLRLPL